MKARALLAPRPRVGPPPRPTAARPKKWGAHRLLALRVLREGEAQPAWRAALDRASVLYPQIDARMDAAIDAGTIPEGLADRWDPLRDEFEAYAGYWSTREPTQDQQTQIEYETNDYNQRARVMDAELPTPGATPPDDKSPPDETPPADKTPPTSKTPPTDKTPPDDTTPPADGGGLLVPLGLSLLVAAGVWRFR